MPATTRELKEEALIRMERAYAIRNGEAPDAYVQMTDDEFLANAVYLLCAIANKVYSLGWSVEDAVTIPTGERRP